MRITLAGHVAIELDSNRLVDGSTLGGSQAAIAFAFLVSERDRLVARDELADLVWGEHVPNTWMTALRGIVQRVRRFLAAAELAPTETLRAAFGCYQLVFPEPLTVDVEDAAAAIDAAERSLALGRATDARDAASAARSIASRGFLPGQSGLWVESRQAWLRNLHVRALGVLAESHLALGEALAAHELVDEMLGLEPLREGAYLLLMRSHEQAGNRAEALRTYERCRVVLADQLGVVPGPEMHQQYLALLGDEPVNAVEPTSTEPAATLPAPFRQLAREPAFVGRSVERERLDASWSDVLGGAYRLVVTSGEPGIGKTRLARELASAAHDTGASVLYGRADPEIGGPYRPFVEAIERFARSAPTDLSARIDPLVDQLTDLLRGPPSQDATVGDLDRYQLFELVATSLSIVSEHAPTLVVLDDLHWADAATLSMLRHVARSSPAGRLLLLALHRDTEARDPTALADTLGELAGLQHVDVVVLRGLDLDDTAALVAGVRGAPQAAPPEDVWRDAGGNPFFVTEVARANDTGTMHKVHQVVSHRVGQLPAPAPDVLALAAAAGPEFDITTMIAASDLDDELVLDALDAAERAGLLVRVPDRPGRLAFAHDLVRSTVYDALAPATVMRMHRTLGWVTETEPLGARDRRSRLAHHFVLAAPLGDWRRAARACVDAAEEAAGALAFESAVSHCDQGLGVLAHAGDPSLDLRCDLEIVRAASLRHISDPTAFDALWVAAATARALGDTLRLARIALSFSPEGGSSNAALLDTDLIDLYEETLAGLDDGHSHDALRARLLGALATELVWSPSVERAVTARRKAVELARNSDDPRALAQVLVTTRHSLTGNGSIDELLALEDELVTLGDRFADPAVLARAFTWRFETSIEAGDGPGAAAALARAETLADALPNQTYRFITTFSRVGYAVISGDLEGAEHQWSSVRDIGARAGIQPVIRNAVALTLLALIRLEQGRLGEIEGELTDALSVGVPAWDSVLAFAHTHLGRHDDAAADVDRALAPGGIDGLLRGVGGIASTTALGHAIAATGDHERAIAVYGALLPYAGRGAFTLVFFGPVDHALGALAITLDRPDAARAHLRAAVEFCDRLGAPRRRSRCAAALTSIT